MKKILMILVAFALAYNYPFQTFEVLLFGGFLLLASKYKGITVKGDWNNYAGIR